MTLDSCGRASLT